MHLTNPQAQPGGKRAGATGSQERAGQGAEQVPRIPKDIRAPDALCRFLSLSRVLPSQGCGPQAAILACRTYQTRALSCIPRADASPPAAPAPPCARAALGWAGAALPPLLLMSVSSGG